jgi:hypothetical protein
MLFLLAISAYRSSMVWSPIDTAGVGFGAPLGAST